MKRLFLAVLVVCASSCRPKGSGTTPTITEATGDEIIIKHPTFFEARIAPKATRDGAKWSAKLEYSTFPEKAAIVVEGKTISLKRGSGEVPTSVDLSSSIGDAPIGILTGGVSAVPLNLPVELTFFDKRQKVSHVFKSVRVLLELRSCLYTPPCAFPNDAPPPNPNANAKPNIIHFAKSDAYSGARAYGSPSKVRDIDWVALSGETDPIDGKKCKMKRFDPGSAVHELESEHVLKRSAERITVYDRRTGAKLRERTLVADDRCPLVADIKLTGANAGLHSELTDGDRERLFKELRGESIPPPATSATPAPKTQKTQKHRK
jgi:hypothetical protein